jgi:hypothetical protein
LVQVAAINTPVHLAFRMQFKLLAHRNVRGANVSTLVEIYIGLKTLPLGNWISECFGQKNLIVYLPLAAVVSRSINVLSRLSRAAK